MKERNIYDGSETAGRRTTVGADEIGNKKSKSKTKKEKKDKKYDAKTRMRKNRHRTVGS